MNKRLALATLFLCTLNLHVCHAGRRLWTAAVPLASSPREFYVAVKGTADNPGTKQSPWDIDSLFAGKHKLAPGSIVWVRGGTYRTKNRAKGKRSGYVVRTKGGTQEQPVHVRAHPREQVIIDGGLIIKGMEHVWLWGFEVLISEAVGKDPHTKTRGSHPGTIPYPQGDLYVMSSKGAKFINFLIHDCPDNGIQLWRDSIDTEVHAAIIYDNGWKAPDRGHGHCIYTQNKDGTKTISGCILSTRYRGQQSIQAYGSSKAYVDNYVFEDNIVHHMGRFLVGGGRPSNNIRVDRNYCYGIPLQIGYTAPQNNDCVVRDNVIVDGGFMVTKFKKAVREGNRLIQGDKHKKGVIARLIPNRYDPNRAHLVVFNWSGEERVPVSVMHKPYRWKKGRVEQSKSEEPWLRDGERFRLMGHKDIFGRPVFWGACSGSKIEVPAPGEFRVYVVLRGR